MRPLPRSHSVWISQYLWTTAYSFTYPIIKVPPPIDFSSKPPPIELCTIYLNEDTKEFEIKKTYFDTFCPLIWQFPSRTNFVKYIGHFFTFPDWTHFYFVSHCTENHEHSRILFVDKQTQTISSFLDVSGELKSIWLSDTEIYIAKKLDGNCMFQEQSIWTNIPHSSSADNASLQYKCPLDSPWRRSQPKKQKKEQILLERINRDGTNYEIFKESDIVFSAEPCLSYTSITSMLKGLAFLADFGEYSFTPHYICIHSDEATPTIILGRNHGYKIHLRWLNSTNFRSPAFFHPTLPLVMTKTNANSTFKIYLLNTANDEERNDFQSLRIPDFSFKERIVWRPT